MKTEARIGDMHFCRLLRLVIEPCGDIIVTMEQGEGTIGGTELGDPRKEVASVEFAVSPLRSPRTHQALLNLYEAMKLDNEESPIPQPVEQ